MPIKFKKFIKNRKGQIGPMSLEDIPSLTIMLIMTMIFIILIFKIVGGYLETNRAVDIYMSANELSNILESKSELVCEENGAKLVGCIDVDRFGSFNLNNYKLAEYECRVEIRYANSNTLIESWGSSKPDKTTIAASSPVGIKEIDGSMKGGVLTAIVWQD